MATMKESHKRQPSRVGRNLATKMMFRALEEGDVATMNFLLKEGKLRINARSSASGDTLLHAAVCHGRCVSVIRRLVRVGCRINTADVTGDTALHLAVRFHRIHLAAELIRLGANVRARNEDGETPLQLAVTNKSHVDVLKIIPNRGDRFNENFYGFASLRLATSADGRPRDWIPALVASYEGKTLYSDELHGLVKMLLNAGADVNARDVDDCSPIQCAVYTGDLELLKTLIDAGADLDNRNQLGCTALHDAVLSCNEPMVHLLLSRGAEVNVGTKDINETALHWALRLNTNNSHKEIIKRLLEFGSDLDRDTEYTTPFQLVLQLGDIDLVTFLVDEHKEDLNKLQWDGSNALTHAAKNQDVRVMELVMQIDHRYGDLGLTPLHYASAMSLLGNVFQLISKGADVNAKDRMNKTPLCQCVGMFSSFNVLSDGRPNYAEERRQVITLLLECGTDLNNLSSTYEENRSLETVLELAIFMKDIEAWKAIIEHAVEIEVRTNQPLFNGHNLRVIEENLAVESYYRKCQAELTAMRTDKIEGSFVSYLSVLTQKLDVVARYTKNDELVNNLQFTLERDAYPIYASQLKKKFDAAIARRKRIDRTLKVLSETLQFADLTDSILENIFKYLNERDIKVLIGNAYKRDDKCQIK